jgi:4'-phosphopantetheinyl transferase EntD
MFSDFVLLSENYSPFQFIDHQRIWSHNSKDIYLAHCSYEKEYFSTLLFDTHCITIPKEIEKSVISRKSDFLAGRYTAKLAINNIQEADFTHQVEIGENRQPLFPLGLCGSISHSSSEAMCIIQKDRTPVCLHTTPGIDIEPVISVQECDVIVDKISAQSERLMLLELGFKLGECATILFSAKESVFKSLSSILVGKGKFNNIVLNRVFTQNRGYILDFVVKVENFCHFTSVEVQLRDNTVYSLCRGRQL